jgi:hypothetical protein
VIIVAKGVGGSGVSFISSADRKGGEGVGQGARGMGVRGKEGKGERNRCWIIAAFVELVPQA